MVSRRCFYVIPCDGTPHILVHRIESDVWSASFKLIHVFDHLPGNKTIYLKWQQLEAGIEALTNGHSRIAREYSPRKSNPYISKVDAGTIELVRSFGPEIAPSSDLIQSFEATWDDEQ